MSFSARGTRPAEKGRVCTGLTGHSGSSGKNSRSAKKRPSFKEKELLRSRRNDQIKLRMQNPRRSLVSNRLLLCDKVIMLLHHICLVSRLLHGSGRILTITRLWTIVEYICIHVLFNILLYVQVMVPLKDRLLLAIIWSKANLIAAKMVRRI